jgi:hypothetical protein
MPSGSREDLSRAVLDYVSQMLVELARMSEEAGRLELAQRLRGVAAEAGLEAADITLSPPVPRARDRQDPQD